MPGIRVDTETTATVYLTGDAGLDCCVVVYEKIDECFKAGIRLCPEHYPEAWEQGLLWVWAAQYSGVAEEFTGSPGCIEKGRVLPGATWLDWTIQFEPETWATFLQERAAMTEERRAELGHAIEPLIMNTNISRLWFKQTDTECSAVLDFDEIRRKDRRWWISLEGKLA